jgi:hypothetical protein
VGQGGRAKAGDAAGDRCGEITQAPGSPPAYVQEGGQGGQGQQGCE